MAGVGGEFQGEDLERGKAVFELLEGEPVRLVLDICANAAADAIAIIVRSRMVGHPDRQLGADLIADEVAENIKLLIRQKHPEVFGIASSAASGRAQ